MTHMVEIALIWRGGIIVRFFQRVRLTVIPLEATQHCTGDQAHMPVAMSSVSPGSVTSLVEMPMSVGAISYYVLMIEGSAGSTRRYDQSQVWMHFGIIIR
jgi:hypothetical protein